jgi:hypothetical protein
MPFFKFPLSEGHVEFMGDTIVISQTDDNGRHNTVVLESPDIRKMRDVFERSGIDPANLDGLDPGETEPPVPSACPDLAAMLVRDCEA